MSNKGMRFPQFQKASDEQILEKYKELGNVWAVGRALGMCGQSVHERLQKLNAIVTSPITREERMFIMGCYASVGHDEALSLDALTELVNNTFGVKRTKATVCKTAREMGLTNQRRKSTEETKKEASIRMSTTLITRSTHSGAAKSGFREDIGMFVRSSWEANYVRYLNWLIGLGKIVRYEYEKHTFRFEGVKRGPYIYIPDFKVFYPDGHHEWHEVKGWMDSKSRGKLKRMAKFFPEEKIVVIDRPIYKSIEQYEAMIPGWEHPTPVGKVSRAKRTKKN